MRKIRAFNSIGRFYRDARWGQCTCLRGQCTCIKTLLLNLYKARRRPVYKTELLKVAKGMFWHGYPCGLFYQVSRDIDAAFSDLLNDGVLFFERGKLLSDNQPTEMGVKALTQEDNFVGVKALTQEDNFREAGL